MSGKARDAGVVRHDGNDVVARLQSVRNIEMHDVRIATRTRRGPKAKIPAVDKEMEEGACSNPQLRSRGRLVQRKLTGSSG